MQEVKVNSDIPAPLKPLLNSPKAPLLGASVQILDARGNLFLKQCTVAEIVWQSTNCTCHKALQSRGRENFVNPQPPTHARHGRTILAAEISVSGEGHLPLPGSAQSLPFLPLRPHGAK